MTDKEFIGILRLAVEDKTGRQVRLSEITEPLQWFRKPIGMTCRFEIGAYSFIVTRYPVGEETRFSCSFASYDYNYKANGFTPAELSAAERELRGRDD